MTDHIHTAIVALHRAQDCEHHGFVRDGLLRQAADALHLAGLSELAYQVELDRNGEAADAALRKLWPVKEEGDTQ